MRTAQASAFVDTDLELKEVDAVLLKLIMPAHWVRESTEKL